MLDLIKLTLSAGNGGHGRVSFRREKFVPKGGPDGGDGGKGGNIILRGNKGMTTLKHFAGKTKFQAELGQMGGKKKCQGLQGQDLILEVPLGTVVWLLAENQASRHRREQYKIFTQFQTMDKAATVVNSAESVEIESPLSKTKTGLQLDKTKSTPKYQYRLENKLKKRDIKLEKYYVEKEGQPVPEHLFDDLQTVQPIADLKTKKNSAGLSFRQGIKLAEILTDGQEIVLCQGGFGGRGSVHFKSSINTTPLEAEYGSFGELKQVVFELRLLADVGLVGLPNAGKSTFLSKITKARPKIANYPFTTIEPNLGILNLSLDEKHLAKQELVVADIPGLIEGASQGKGLGFQFLRHIENCQVLMYVLYLEEALVFDQSQSVQQKAQALWQQYQSLQKELNIYQKQSEEISKEADTAGEATGHGLIDIYTKPYILTLNKIDIYNKDLVKACQDFFAKKGEKLHCFSGVTNDGLAEVKKALVRAVRD